MEANKTDVRVVLVPYPAQGHLNQFLHLAILLSSHGLTVYYAAPTTPINQAKSRLEGWHASAIDSIHFHDLPIPPIATTSPNSNSSFPSHLRSMREAFDETRPHLANLLRSLSSTSRHVVVISETLSSFAATEAAAIPNGEPYADTLRCVSPSIYLSWQDRDSSAGALLKSLSLNAPSMDDCCPPGFSALMAQSQNKPECGLLLNTSRAIEGELLDFYKQQPNCIAKNIFAIGPLNPTVIAESTGPRHHCLDWLDKQPVGSVLYITFGSSSSILDGQIEQLAIGLLNSGQRFIWLLKEADGVDGLVERENGRQDKLPPGFFEKIKGKGIVIGDWVPQLDILSHKAIACFMSHCGWNSCLESISMGVPLLALPLNFDQPWNAVLVSSYLKIGMTVRDWDRRRELLPAAEIEKAIKEMMVYEKGEEIKRRASELGEAVRRAVSDGGSSFCDLLSFINNITRS